MKKMGLMGLMGLMILGTCLALTPKERELVQGLNGINAELRAGVEAQAAQIGRLETDVVFAAQKIESLTANLITAKQNEEAQLQDLILQQGKITAQNQVIDFQTKRADKAEAKNAVLLPKYHKLKFYAASICGILAGGLAGLLILRWGGLALNSVPGAAIAFGGPVVVAGIVFTAIQVMF